MDGAMGTQLQRAGLPQDTCGEWWNLSRPDQVLAIHQAYAAAGAQVLVTNTFQANPETLAKHGLGQRLEEVFQAALALARPAAGPERLVFAGIGPVENLNLARAISLVNAARSADAILLETWSDPDAALLFGQAMAGGATSRRPVLVSFSFWRGSDGGDLRTFKGFTPEACARVAHKLQAAALGVNCGRGLIPDDFLQIIRRYHSLTDLPLFVRPNAGTPHRLDNHWVYPETATTLAAWLPSLLEAGVSMVGGCCGTTPEHIAAFRSLVETLSAKDTTV